MPVVDVDEIAAALLDRAVNGFDGKEDLFNEDLVRTGRGVLDGSAASEAAKGSTSNE